MTRTEELYFIEKMTEIVATVSELKAENKLLKEWNKELREQKNISFNLPVSGQLPLTDHIDMLKDRLLRCVFKARSNADVEFSVVDWKEIVSQIDDWSDTVKGNFR